MPVYFIRARGGFGPVKIGHSKHPEVRLQALMTYAPYPLEVVAKIEGAGRLERQFHALFREHHSHREWFHPCPEIERAIEQIRAGLFDLDTLPNPKRLGVVSKHRWSDLQREALSLSHRLRLRAEDHGFYTPSEWRDALHRYAELPEKARCDLAKMILRHIEDPTVCGVVIPAAWARDAAAAYIAKRAA